MGTLHSKCVVVLILTLFFGFSTWAPSGWPAEAKEGKVLFEKLCVSCHGPDGKGNPAMIKVLGEKVNIATTKMSQKTDDEILKLVTQGKGMMPAAGKGLSDQEKKELIGYVRSLAK